VRHDLEIYISMGCMGLEGIMWFLPIDKKFPELGIRGGILAAQARTADPSLLEMTTTVTL
jgi:hypothetical protein